LPISPSKCGWCTGWPQRAQGPPEATADAVVSEWFSTGDIGQVDEEGCRYIVARKKI
jgi:acyl-CoA synthetase (AMP-forming)/AMP-acid ligase II